MADLFPLQERFRDDCHSRPDSRPAYSRQINGAQGRHSASGTMNNRNEIRKLTDAEQLTDDALKSVSGGKGISKGVINSSAISLPKPSYPPVA